MRIKKFPKLSMRVTGFSAWNLLVTSLVQGNPKFIPSVYAPILASSVIFSHWSLTSVKCCIIISAYSSKWDGWMPPLWSDLSYAWTVDVMFRAPAGIVKTCFIVRMKAMWRELRRCVREPRSGWMCWSWACSGQSVNMYLLLRMQ